MISVFWQILRSLGFQTENDIAYLVFSPGLPPEISRVLVSPGLEDPAQEVYPGLLRLQLPEFRIHFPEPQFAHLICGMSRFAKQCLITLDPPSPLCLSALPSNASPIGYSFQQMAL